VIFILKIQDKERVFFAIVYEGFRFSLFWMTRIISEQINSLLVTDVVGSRSLILITSRDQDLLRRSSPKTVLYNVKPLQREACPGAFLPACVPSIKTMRRI
jgi:hypothetical protein